MTRTANILSTTAFVAFAILGFSAVAANTSQSASVQLADDAPSPSSTTDSTDSMGWQ
ncbi:hypothetical protein GCM10009555_076440 [Acrocarpospora macrocephala]|uniref:Secreted protein n=1 Tax=Acrocarpospora macrocephala TaxID=150177 RepID=A0A5M3X213_9ACTN|nr:hypothetical protein [Acrocarpospora macrocephala]GES12813.1 hypothetical protein Amac_064100 [Acrocarpospora macrocephala]